MNILKPKMYLWLLILAIGVISCEKGEVTEESENLELIEEEEAFVINEKGKKVLESDYLMDINNTNLSKQSNVFLKKMPESDLNKLLKENILPVRDELFFRLQRTAGTALSGRILTAEINEQTFGQGGRRSNENTKLNWRLTRRRVGDVRRVSLGPPSVIAQVEKVNPGNQPREAGNLGKRTRSQTIEKSVSNTRSSGGSASVEVSVGFPIRIFNLGGSASKTFDYSKENETTTISSQTESVEINFESNKTIPPGSVCDFRLLEEKIETVTTYDLRMNVAGRISIYPDREGTIFGNRAPAFQFFNVFFFNRPGYDNAAEWFALPEKFRNNKVIKTFQAKNQFFSYKVEKVNCRKL
ncbi:hypothetical protein [Aquimarina algicola]|uniref:Lipoprotein n=1 Tax=Aquimarina algicola TaxID=2589995 RepID=A0A504J0W9_9FLAO|nr:hypothetical protein [Aquimarina algicola]TPN84467.1 hypothetical protein FHK87_16170 [Aquimarina algicola]